MASLFAGNDFFPSQLPLLGALAIDVGLASGAGAFGAVGGLGFWLGWAWVRRRLPPNG